MYSAETDAGLKTIARFLDYYESMGAKALSLSAHKLRRKRFDYS